MTEPAATATDPAAPPAEAKPKKKEDSFVVFVIKLVLIVVIFRSFVFAPFSIPSESMLPGLRIGDYLLAAKWPYGYSSYSLPWSAPLIPGRILPGQPERGDVVIFKAPPNNDTDYIKRVIGLPGDTIQMKGGVLWLNGAPIPKERVGDVIVPITPNMIAAAERGGNRNHPCVELVFAYADRDGVPSCRFPQYRETLPNGTSYTTIDMGPTPQDNTEVRMVPEDSVFLMGDNRDNSMDSRFPAIQSLGVGIVPQANLVGRATIMMWSTDGSAEWIKPWTWFTAARWDRIGMTF